MSLGDEELVVWRLSQHFKFVIQQLVQRVFKQLLSTREITRELVNKKKKTYYFTFRDYLDLSRTNCDAETKWLGVRNIKRKLTELKNKVNIFFISYTCILGCAEFGELTKRKDELSAIIREVFGERCVGSFGVGTTLTPVKRFKRQRREQVESAGTSHDEGSKPAGDGIVRDIVIEARRLSCWCW